MDGIYLRHGNGGLRLMVLNTKFSMRVNGIENLERELKTLSKPLQQKSLAEAVMKGARVIRDQARSQAPRGKTGNLQQEIKARLKKGTRWVMAAAVSWTKGGGRYPGYYGLFLEKGTKRRQRKSWREEPLKTPANTGVMVSRPFLEPAYDSKKAKAAQVMKAELARAIRKRVKGRG